MTASPAFFICLWHSCLVDPLYISTILLIFYFLLTAKFTRLCRLNQTSPPYFFVSVWRFFFFLAYNQQPLQFSELLIVPIVSCALFGGVQFNTLMQLFHMKVQPLSCLTTVSSSSSPLPGVPFIRHFQNLLRNSSPCRQLRWTYVLTLCVFNQKQPGSPILCHQSLTQPCHQRHSKQI